jgi:tetratricopeptide (TPR) repeat protein
VVARQSNYNLPVNFIVIAGKRPINLENINNEENLEDAELIIHDENDIAAFGKKTGWIILDDDYVPVDNFMIPVVREVSAASIAEKYIEQAHELDSAGKWEDALGKYRMVIQSCPALSARSNYLMWHILAEHNKWAQAADALRSVLAGINQQTEKNLIAMLHYQLGTALNKTGDNKEASSHFAEAIKLLREDLAEKGESAQAYLHLGQVYSAINNTNDANLCFEKAKQLREDKPK